MLPRRAAGILLFGLLAGVVTAVMPSPVAAQLDAALGSDDFPITVVDVQGVMRASQAARMIHDLIEARRTAYHEAATADERRLRQVEQDLAQQRAALAPEAYQQQVREFQAQVVEVQRQVQLRKRALDEAFTAAMSDVRQALVSVVAEIAEERRIKLVLFKSQIVIAEKALDISDETLKRLDERLPSVAVNLPPLQ
jgi:Skp family chaperone for outer membrane proteins